MKKALNSIIGWLKENSALVFTVVLSILLLGVSSYYVYRYSDLLFVEKAKNHEVLRNTVLAIAAIVSLPFVIWRAQANDRSSKASYRQSQVALKQIEIATDSQINDRFTRAMELFNSEDLSNRIAGIMSLAEIAEDSEKYVRVVLEVFCLRIREVTTNSGYVEDREAFKYKYGYFEPRIDIQTMLSLLGKGVFKDRVKDFTRAYLAGAKLSVGGYKNSTFWGVNFEKAHFAVTDVSGSYFWDTNLLGCKFSNVEVIDVDFTGAKLFGTNFEDTKGLEEWQLKNTLMNSFTRLPEHLQHLVPKE